MEEHYKGHLIIDRSTLNPDTQRWTPNVGIIWDEGGSTRFVTLDRPVDHSASKEEAERDAIQLGRKWIDDGKPDLGK